MEVKNLAWNENLSKHYNHPLLPKGIRELIIGKSGCGKTTLLINLLLRSGWLDYNNINIFGKRLFQPEYHILKKAFEERLPKEVIIRLFENKDKITYLSISSISVANETAKNIWDKSDVECTFYESAEDVSDHRELRSEKKNLMVFDDLLHGKENTCESYYVRGRHSNVDCFYLAQNNCKLPAKQSERTRISYCLFPQDLKNLNHIFEDHVGSNMTKKEFRQLCKTAWEKQHGFVIIDISSKKNNDKYRSGLGEFYISN